MGAQTVDGVIPAEALGHAQLHEHLFVRHTPAAGNNPALQISSEAQSAEELRGYRAAGGGTILDAQPLEAGRDALALCRISERSAVHIIAVTGYHMPMFYPEGHWVYRAPEAELFERFALELDEGMEQDGARTPIRAGAVKAAIPAQGATGRFEINLRAAAKAAATRRVPLVLHTEAGAQAVSALRLCETQGLDPGRVLVCHADRQAEDYAIHERIAQTGAFLEYDTIARARYHDDAAEYKLILHMLDRGYLRQLLLSLDTTADRLQCYGGQIGLCHLFTHFLPALRREGLTERDIETITVKNPRRVFET